MKRRVLLVDDEPAILIALGRLLEGRGFEVRTAEHGGAALEVLAAQTFDVVLSDVCMPVMDGPAMLQAMHALRPPLRCPVVFLSGYGDFAEQTLRDLGAVAILGKPISSSDLVEALDRACRNPGSEGS